MRTAGNIVNGAVWKTKLPPRCSVYQIVKRDS